MISEKEQCVSDTSANFTLMFWVYSGVLLYLIAQNVESVETSYRVTRHSVEISGFEFVPKQLKVKAGDTITWINKDIVPHNIIESIDKKNISPVLAAGEIFTYVVKKPMTYQCGLHPSMKGKLSMTKFP